MLSSSHYSVRRETLDRDLAAAAAEMTGEVLEIGGGRTGRRGLFQPPTRNVSRWMFLDYERGRRPHVQADACALPFADERFDTVVCLEVLEYVWQADRAMLEFARVLRRGGTLILSTPFVHRVDADNDYWRFGEPALRRLAVDAGLTVSRIDAQGHALASAVNILRFVVSERSRRSRQLLSFLLAPLFNLLLALDASSARRWPALARFTTGYLMVATRAKGRL